MRAEIRALLPRLVAFVSLSLSLSLSISLSLSLSLSLSFSLSLSQPSLAIGSLTTDRGKSKAERARRVAADLDSFGRAGSVTPRSVTRSVLYTLEHACDSASFYPWKTGEMFRNART